MFFRFCLVWSPLFYIKGLLPLHLTLLALAEPLSLVCITVFWGYWVHNLLSPYCIIAFGLIHALTSFLTDCGDASNECNFLFSLALLVFIWTRWSFCLLYVLFGLVPGSYRAIFLSLVRCWTNPWVCCVLQFKGLCVEVLFVSSVAYAVEFFFARSVRDHFVFPVFLCVAVSCCTLILPLLALCLAGISLICWLLLDHAMGRGLKVHFLWLWLGSCTIWLSFGSIPFNLFALRPLKVFWAPSCMSNMVCWTFWVDCLDTTRF